MGGNQKRYFLGIAKITTKSHRHKTEQRNFETDLTETIMGPSFLPTKNWMLGQQQKSLQSKSSDIQRQLKTVERNGQ